MSIDVLPLTIDGDTFNHRDLSSYEIPDQLSFSPVPIRRKVHTENVVRISADSLYDTTKPVSTEQKTKKVNIDKPSQQSKSISSSNVDITSAVEKSDDDFAFDFDDVAPEADTKELSEEKKKELLNKKSTLAQVAKLSEEERYKISMEYDARFTLIQKSRPNLNIEMYDKTKYQFEEGVTLEKKIMIYDKVKLYINKLQNFSIYKLLLQIFSIVIGCMCKMLDLDIDINMYLQMQQQIVNEYDSMLLEMIDDDSKGLLPKIIGQDWSPITKIMVLQLMVIVMLIFLKYLPIDTVQATEFIKTCMTTVSSNQASKVRMEADDNGVYFNMAESALKTFAPALIAKGGEMLATGGAGMFHQEQKVKKAHNSSSDFLKK